MTRRERGFCRGPLGVVIASQQRHKHNGVVVDSGEGVRGRNALCYVTCTFWDKAGKNRFSKERFFSIPFSTGCQAVMDDLYLLM